MFYIKNTKTGETIRESATPFNVDEKVQPDGDIIQLKRVEDATKPVFDAGTQKLNWVFVDDDKKFTRTFKFEVVALSAEELNRKQKFNEDETKRAQIKAFLTALENGSGLPTERLARLEKVAVFLLRNEMR